MSVCLDRFAYGIADPQEREHEILGLCSQCGEKILPGYERVEWQNEVFCDLYCFARYMGAREVY
jgi:hypothetical protein